MNNEQQDLLNEAYENYCTTLIGSINFSERGKHFKSNGLEFNSGYPNYVHYAQEEFINKCKTNPEFSEKWGLKIDERDLSLEERMKVGGLKYNHKPSDNGYTEIDEHRVLDEINIPTKKITITYNDKKGESYE